MKTGIILLARMSSSRLPGKVLLKVCGKTILEHVIRRLENVSPASEIIVATTRNKKDGSVEALCKSIGVSCFRGDEDNVLQRCIDAVQAFDLDHVIRLGADSPLIDCEVISDMLHVYFRLLEEGKDVEYMSNTMDRSFPLGLDAEIFKQETFLRIDKETRNLPRDERISNEINVIPYLHQNKERFSVVSYKKDFDYSHLRWTLDTPEDLELITRIYESLYPVNPRFLLKDILELLRKNPDWSLLNSGIVPRSGFWTEKEQDKLRKRLDRGTTGLGTGGK